MICACRQRNIFVQRQRVRDAINNFDPVSRALRKPICIRFRFRFILSYLQIEYGKCLWGLRIAAQVTLSGKKIYYVKIFSLKLLSIRLIQLFVDVYGC